MHISDFIIDCNEQIKKLSTELERIKRNFKGASVASTEFLKMQVEELESRINFHEGARESIARRIREAEEARLQTISNQK
jgi:hypothetical protein